MKLIKPFRGLRPTGELASRVAAPPYDVLSREEALVLARDNPLSFLHVNRPEVDLDPAIDPFDHRVYDKGRENLQRLIDEGVLRQDPGEHFYVYQQVMGNHEQAGLVAVASIDAYEQNRIRKHEFTRPRKEDDRVAHMDALGAQVGPVLMTYRAQDAIDRLVARAMTAEPAGDFVADDGVRHVFRVIDDAALTAQLEASFNQLDCLYIADGHHRSAAAARTRQLYRDRNPAHRGDEPCNYFLVVLFPHHQMQILDYNRVLRDLNGLAEAQLLDSLKAHFQITEVESGAAAKPRQPRDFALYTGGRWRRLRAGQSLLDRIDENNPVQNLDVSILQDFLFGPLLGIEDQRTDERVDFVGGVRGLETLEQRVDSGDWQAAIAFYPTSMESLMAIADAGKVMPPKSTWFEPKLRSGLVSHLLDWPPTPSGNRAATARAAGS